MDEDACNYDANLNLDTSVVNPVCMPEDLVDVSKVILEKYHRMPVTALAPKLMLEIAFSSQIH